MPKALRERDPRQECGCPPWVLMCAHWDGYITTLVTEGKEQEHAPGCLTEVCPAPYHVNNSTGYGPCNGCGVPDRLLGITEYWCGENLPAAQAEFARRAELLRLGGGDG